MTSKRTVPANSQERSFCAFTKPFRYDQSIGHVGDPQSLNLKPQRHFSVVPPEIEDYLPMHDHLRVRDVCEQYGLSDPTVRKMIRDDRLPAYRMGRNIFIRREDIDKAMKPMNPTAAENQRASA